MAVTEQAVTHLLVGARSSAANRGRLQPFPYVFQIMSTEQSLYCISKGSARS